MEKRIILFIIGAVFLGALSFSMTEDTRKVIIMKGGTRLLPSSSVQVVMEKTQTLTTTFNKDVNNATITVRKQSGEIVSIENVDAKEMDTYFTEIPEYQEGEYTIEISTPDGELEGNF